MINARRYRELMRAKEQLAEDNRALSADMKRTIGAEVVGADFGLREVMEQVRQDRALQQRDPAAGRDGNGQGGDRERDPP